MNTKPRLLYFVTEDWYFCSHRLHLAKAAQSSGFDVSVLTRVDQHADIIKSAGIKLIPLNIHRGGINPWHELQTLFQIGRVYWRLKPDLVHHVALKPVLYGNLVALMMPSIKVVNLLAGLGAIFSSDQLKAKLLKPLIKAILRLILHRRNSYTISQNQEDFAMLSEQLRIPITSLKLIKGSGVDIDKYYPVTEPCPPVTIALVSRLLWDKGVGEYISAIKLLKLKGLNFQALLVGDPDKENMASISAEQLNSWNQEGFVSWLGYVENIAEFWQNNHISVLPSYREGLPKSLLEAAACGRPIVTTNTSGCREVVEDGINGFLVPVRDVQALANAIEKLLQDKNLRTTMGQASRQKVEREFAENIVFKQTISLYQELLRCNRC